MGPKAATAALTLNVLKHWLMQDKPDHTSVPPALLPSSVREIFPAHTPTLPTTAFTLTILAYPPTHTFVYSIIAMDT
jgi:hypothetical protein